MFKWLDKVTNNKTEPVKPPSATSASAPSAPSRPAAPAKPVEVPLEAPVITAEAIGREEEMRDGVLARKVLVDRAYHPSAYEFSLRPDSTQHGENQAVMLVRLLAHLGSDRLSATRPTWIRLADTELDMPELTLLPADRIVLAIEVANRSAEDDDRWLQTARALRDRGFRIALTNWNDSALHKAWLLLAKFVEIDLDQHNPMDVGELPERLKTQLADLLVVATGVDSYEVLEFCHRARYDLFRGAFLTNREHWPRQPKINPERVRICQFLNQLNSGAELNDIAGDLRHSPELSYRLLRYINSAGMGLMVPIASVQQGLVILGRDKTYRWLTVLLFSASQGRSIDTALLEQALVRARMLETLAKKRFNKVQVDELFTVGIFSLLDLLLKLPMSVALEPLKLPATVYSALVEEGGPYASWLQLTTLAEGDDTPRLRDTAAQLDLRLGEVNEAQLDALHWTQEVLAT